MVRCGKMQHLLLAELTKASSSQFELVCPGGSNRFLILHKQKQEQRWTMSALNSFVGSTIIM